MKNVINKHKSNKIKENSNTVRHLNNGTDRRHSKSCCDQSSPARRTISEHRDTISCHPPCCTNDLIDMKGRCCPKIVLSIPRSLFTSGQPNSSAGSLPGNYDTSEASYRKQRFRYDGKFVKKREVDIISRYK